DPLTIAGLVGALDNATDFAAELDNVLAAALSTVLDEASTLQLSKMYNGLGLSGNDILTIRNDILTQNDPTNAGTKALGLAYIRSEAQLQVSSTSNSSITPVLKVLGQTVPGNLIDWEI